MKYPRAIKYLSLGIFILAISLPFIYFFMAPPRVFPVKSVFKVEEGRALSPLSAELKEKGIIRSALALKVFTVLFGGDRHIVAGKYYFDRPIAVWNVAHRISNGSYHLEAVKITVPEGFDVQGIANLLGDKLIGFDKIGFMSMAQGKEGYLFPDTYFFYYSATPEEVIKMMNDNFKSKTGPLQAQIVSSGKTLGEIITMASLIEKESGGPDDKLLISSIIWKRIKLKMLLQVDATIVYLSGRSGPQLMDDDFKIDSPYNTYIHKGLPPAPIANPGLDAIMAALNPVETPYLFYLHGKDGMLYTAEDYEEHKLNREKYL